MPCRVRSIIKQKDVIVSRILSVSQKKKKKEMLRVSLPRELSFNPGKDPSYSRIMLAG